MLDPMSAFNSPSDEDWLSQANQQQMFTLIEQLLPLEACLYYRVLPLSLDGSRLNLGMVDPEDTAAADYVRRLLSYINCSIAPRQISLDGHHAMLTRYLNYSQNNSQRSTPALSEGKFDGNPATAQQNPNPAQSFPVYPDQNQKKTFIVDSPDELEAQEAEFPQPLVEPHPSAWPVHDATLDQTLVTDEDELNRPLTPQDFQSFDQSTYVLQEMEQSVPMPPSLEQTEVIHSPPSAQPNSPLQPVHPLELCITSFSLPLDLLPQQEPKTILYELLGQVLKEGIGRLYFEHHQHQGRILWSQDGVMQSAIEKLDLPRFEGVISELKRLAGLPLLPVQSTKQIEVERIYQGARLLLRFRVMPGKHGEEATLQVLRGAALKFYERQIINRLGRDALGLAYKLQQQLNEIRSRARAELASQSLDVESLPALRELLLQLDQQIQDLMAEHDKSH